jgi:hypothetical protein
MVRDGEKLILQQLFCKLPIAKLDSANCDPNSGKKSASLPEQWIAQTNPRYNK